MKASGHGVSRFAVVVYKVLLEYGVYKVLLEYGDMMSPQINGVF